jgi:hypothetical protein
VSQVALALFGCWVVRLAVLGRFCGVNCGVGWDFVGLHLNKVMLC